MPIVNKTKRTAAIYNHGREVVKVYDHGNLAWQKSTSIPDYLCFTALEAGQFTLTIPAAVTSTYLSYVEWSKDGRTWNHTDNTSEAVTIDVQVASGEKVYWRGSGTKMSISSTDYSNFSSNARFDVSGYLMSLTRLDDFVDHNTFGTDSYSEGLFRDNTKLVSAQDLVFPENVTNYCLRSLFVACTAMTTPPRTLPQLPSTANAANYFSYMFKGCTSLTSAPPLPSMKVGGSAYYHMFYGCTSLTTPPALPATTLGGSCYRGMFRGSGITTAPALPATTLQSYCYCEMFQDCKSLTTPPDLPAPAMVTYCYNGMFNGSGITTPPVISATSFNGGQAHCRYMFRNCKSLTTAAEINIDVLAANCYEQMYQYCTNLSHIKCLATDISATGCLTNWTDGVAASGTFIQAEGVEWPRGASGIPTGWVDVEKRTMPSGYRQVEYLQAVKPYPSNYNAAIVGTGIVLDPSQDTIEFAVWPRLDEDGYLINGGGSTAGEMPFANSSSPTSTTAKVGLFYTLYRVNSSTNLFSTFFTRENGDGTNKALGSSLDAYNKVTDNPQTIRVEFSATSSVMYLNGTQVASRSGYTVDTSDTTTTQAFVLAYNNTIYSWEHPFYYLKWWRSGTMIADYVPCVRESDDEVGFYDFASQTFKTRYYTSSEPFTAGEEI